MKLKPGGQPNFLSETDHFWSRLVAPKCRLGALGPAGARRVLSYKPLQQHRDRNSSFLLVFSCRVPLLMIHEHKAAPCRNRNPLLPPSLETKKTK